MLISLYKNYCNVCHSKSSNTQACCCPSVTDSSSFPSPFTTVNLSFHSSFMTAVCTLMTKLKYIFHRQYNTLKSTQHVAIIELKNGVTLANFCSLLACSHKINLFPSWSVIAVQALKKNKVNKKSQWFMSHMPLYLVANKSDLDSSLESYMANIFRNSAKHDDEKY